jgi:hypothetical protein
MEPTSPNAPANESSSAPAGADYLAGQIADARQALEATFDDLTLDLGKAADLRKWVRRYPWPALGAALVAGFTLAHAVKSQRSAKGESDHPEGRVQSDDSRGGNNHSKERTRVEQAAVGWRSTLLIGLFDLLRVAVTQFINASFRQASGPAGVRSAPQPTSKDESGDPYGVSMSPDSLGTTRMKEPPAK